MLRFGVGKSAGPVRGAGAESIADDQDPLVRTWEQSLQRLNHSNCAGRLAGGRE